MSGLLYTVQDLPAAPHDAAAIAEVKAYLGIASGVTGQIFAVDGKSGEID